MVRKAFYLIRERYPDAKTAAWEMFKKGITIHGNTLRSFERGTKTFDPGFTKAIARFYGVSVEELLEEDGLCWREATYRYGR